MKPPRPQFLLSELIALIAICAAGFAMLKTLVAPLGIGLLAIVPGFVLERLRGGTGIIGGTISGALIPPAIATAWMAREYQASSRSIGWILSTIPVLGVLFVICLVCSISASSMLYVLDMGLRGSRRVEPGRGRAKGASER